MTKVTQVFNIENGRLGLLMGMETLCDGYGVCRACMKIGNGSITNVNIIFVREDMASDRLLRMGICTQTRLISSRACGY